MLTDLGTYMTHTAPGNSTSAAQVTGVEMWVYIALDAFAVSIDQYIYFPRTALDPCWKHCLTLVLLIACGKWEHLLILEKLKSCLAHQLAWVVWQPKTLRTEGSTLLALLLEFCCPICLRREHPTLVKMSSPHLHIALLKVPVRKALSTIGPSRLLRTMNLKIGAPRGIREGGGEYD